MKYDLSIIIVNYNTADLVRECLLSIKKTTDNFKSPKTEVILVDNGSKDLGELLKLVGGNVKLIKNDDNLGFSKANNQGIKQALGDYILLLNSDTRVNAGAIKKLLDFAKDHPDVGVVGAKLLNKDGTAQDSVLHFPNMRRAIAEFWFGRKIYSKYIPQGSQPVQVDAVVGAAFLITPIASKNVGLLDERYFFYFEDLDYCRKVQKAGLKVYYLPEAEVIHLHGVSGKNLIDGFDQWRRLIPSSKIYNGILKHYLLFFVIWIGEGRNKLLIAFFLAGLLLRLLLSVQIYSGDVNNHISWAKDSVSLGLSGIYEREFAVRYGTMTPTYPPVTILLFAVSYFLFDTLNKLSWSLNASLPIFPSNLVFFFQNQNTLPAFLKIPGILADLGISFVVFLFVRRFIGGRKWPLIGASFILFNPAFFYNSAVWGQIEAIPLFFILASFYLLLFTKRSLFSAVLFVTALLVKQTSIIFIPIYALAFYKKFSFYGITKALIGSIVLFWLSFLPFHQKGNILLFPFSTYLNKIQNGSGSDYVTDHAFNFWSLVNGLSKISDSKPFIIGVPFVFLGYGIFGILYLVTLYKAYKNKFQPADVLTAVTLISTASFLFLTRIHERYLEQALPFLLLVAVLKKKWLVVFIFFSLFYLLNLYHNWWAPRIQPVEVFLSSKTNIDVLTTFAIIGFLFLFVRYLKGSLLSEK